MKRKTISLIAALLLVASFLTVPAAAISTPSDPGISPLYEDMRTFYASISKDNGKVNCYSFASTATSSYTVYLTMTLQRSSGSGWTNVTSWSTSGTGSAKLNKSYYVTSSYSYRTKAVATIYTSSGKYVEQATTYSCTVWFFVKSWKTHPINDRLGVFQTVDKPARSLMPQTGLSTV